MTMKRTGSCPCGQLKVECVGEPVRVSVCHCLNCQQRSGSAFAAQARWRNAQVTLTGDWNSWERVGDEGSRASFRFCPTCGSTVTFSGGGIPGMTAVPIGVFADPSFLPPTVSVYKERAHGWVAILGEGVDHFS